MIKHYHLIGIGGVGMSALAYILLNKGEKVSGSDIRDSPTTEALRRGGAEVFIGHHTKNIKSAHVVVYSTDIPKDNVEYLQAKKKQIPVLHRSKLLAQIIEGFAPILVTGTHGKTTTASLLSHVMIEAKLDPSYAIGGFINGAHSNGRSGRGLYFVVEADESDGTFLNYPSFGAIITNLEQDHMDYWKNEETLLKGFEQFAIQVGSKDHLFWCQDDPLLKSLKLDGYSFGFSEDADLVIEDFRQANWKMFFDISFKGKHYHNLEIPLIGGHNVLNASAIFGLGLQLDIDEKILRKGLENFRGVSRRVEKKGEIKEIEIYDDYAHHPTEIFATLRSLKKALPRKRIVLAFQPHRYSRTKYCMDGFADAFEYADEVVLTDIYAANESPFPGLTGEKLLKRIKEDGYLSIRFVEREKLIKFLSEFLKPKDVLITMGAGDITTVGPAILNVFEKQ